MNERLTYLWEQANIRYSVYETAKPREERKTVPDIFSQMIIRDCLDITRWKDYEMSNEQRIRLGIYQDIKKHFGIEE